jgi:hypothetical protein
MGLFALPAIPPIVEGLLWLGATIGVVGTGHQVLPGKEQREQSVRDLANAMSMSNAQDDAKANADSGTVAATCATGNCPPGCKDREDAMRKDAETIKRRINEMKLDEHDLYNNHYYEWQAHPVYGSWLGHARQIKQTQKALNNKRLLSEKEKCPKPSSSILEWLKSNAPSAPRGQ